MMTMTIMFMKMIMMMMMIITMMLMKTTTTMMTMTIVFMKMMIVLTKMMMMIVVPKMMIAVMTLTTIIKWRNNENSDYEMKGSIRILDSPMSRYARRFARSNQRRFSIIDNDRVSAESRCPVGLRPDYQTNERIETRGRELKSGLVELKICGFLSPVIKNFCHLQFFIGTAISYGDCEIYSAF